MEDDQNITIKYLHILIFWSNIKISVSKKEVKGQSKVL